MDLVHMWHSARDYTPVDPPQLLCAGACSGLSGPYWVNDAQEGGTLLALFRVRTHRPPTEQGPMPWHT